MGSLDHYPQDLAPLVAAARAGGRAAFTQLVERYHRLVFKIALYKASDLTDAEDITQDVFLHAFRSLPNLREPQAFTSWLISLTHNRAHRFCRRRQRQRAALERVRREQEVRTDRELRATRLYGPEAGAAGIGELVRDLPAEYRQALTWKYLDGESYEQIGARLSLSFHQVDYLLRKAKRALRTAVTRQERTREGKAAGESLLS